MDIPKIKAKSGHSWAPIFFVGDFLADDPVLELEYYALKERKLRMLGERVTKLRGHLLAAAKDQAFLENKELSAGEKEVKIHGQKVRNRG